MDGRGQSEKGDKPAPPPYEEIQPSYMEIIDGPAANNTQNI